MPNSGYEYGVEIERNRIRLGRVNQRYDLSHRPDYWFEQYSWDTNVIWGSHGLYTFTLGDLSNPPPDETHLFRQINERAQTRGSYLVDGDTLYLFWIPSGELADQIVMPDYIPRCPESFIDNDTPMEVGKSLGCLSSVLLVLKRPDSKLMLDFQVNPLPRSSDARATIAPFERLTIPSRGSLPPPANNQAGHVKEPPWGLSMHGYEPEEAQDSIEDLQHLQQERIHRLDREKSQTPDSPLTPAL